MQDVLLDASLEHSSGGGQIWSQEPSEIGTQPKGQSPLGCCSAG